MQKAKFNVHQMNKNLKELIEYPKTGILSKEVFKNETIGCTLFCLASGAEISEHTSTRPGFVYVIEGKGIFNLAGRDTVMESGVLIYMEENIIHSLKAESDISFLLMLIAGKKVG